MEVVVLVVMGRGVWEGDFFLFFRGRLRRLSFFGEFEEEIWFLSEVVFGCVV